jgi:tryptophan 2,3-dioxygenase
MAGMESELIEPEAGGLSYDSYLKVRELLKLQQAVSKPAEHDEMLFIIIHQVYELWFRQLLHEIDRCFVLVKEDDLMAFLKVLKRICTIQQTLTKQVDILETMTPNDFARFRNLLNPASGFQSFQFRLVEFKLGERNTSYLKFHRHQPEFFLRLESALATPSLYDEVLFSLKRSGFGIPDSVLDRDLSQSHVAHPEVSKAIATIYHRSTEFYPWFLVLEALADLDENFLLWRFRHVAMVSRMIGMHRGTGGSSGVSYLSSTLTKRFFPDIWESRNLLGTAT